MCNYVVGIKCPKLEEYFSDLVILSGRYGSIGTRRKDFRTADVTEVDCEFDFNRSPNALGFVEAVEGLDYIEGTTYMSKQKPKNGG